MLSRAPSKFTSLVIMVSDHLRCRFYFNWLGRIPNYFAPQCDFEGCFWSFYTHFRLKRHKATHLKKKDFLVKIRF
jgi:hypothetical protein